MSSSTAVAAREAASILLAGCRQQEYAEFARKMVRELTSCFRTQYSGKREREVMWGKFHQLRSSPTYKQIWDKYIENVTGKATSPIFPQLITQHMFEQLVVKRFAVAEAEKDSVTSLTHIEKNVLRYTAGYVCRTVKKDVEKSKRKDKEELLFCLMELSGDEGDEDRGTEDWTNARDRGGLWHISDMAFDLFCAIEEEVRCHLILGEMTEGMKENIMTAVIESDDVLFQWCMFGADLDSSQTRELLGMIVKLYITSRGHSFASTCVEKYKQEHKKTLQKGGGLRKELFTSTVGIDSENNVQ